MSSGLPERLQLVVGCSGKGERAVIRKATLGLLCRGLGVRFDHGVPPRTTVPSLKGETICLADGSSRTL